METGARKAVKPTDRPFYAAPENVPISSKIINEARSSLRTLKTNRPFTPREENRSLFGATSVRSPENRPPSAFSLGSKHFDGSDSRPVSGTRPVLIGPLAPLPTPDHKTARAGDGEGVWPPKPPTSDVGARLTGRRLPRAVGLPSSSSNEEVSAACSAGSDESRPSSGSEGARRVRSGPKERTGTGATPTGDQQIIAGDSRSNSASADSRRKLSENGYATHLAPIVKKESSLSGRINDSSAVGDSNQADGDTSFYVKRIEPILDAMGNCKGDNVRLHVLSTQLYAALQEGDLLGRKCKQRAAILKTVFRYLDSGDTELLLVMSRLILALNVSGNNLTNVCKLVFKLCREEENDSYFAKDLALLGALVEVMGSTEPVTGGDALVYCLGSLKLLSGAGAVCKILVQLPTIEAAAQLFDNINAKVLEKGQKEQIGHILVQLTGTIRNLADTGSSRQKFLTHRIIEHLCTVVDQYEHDADLVLNVSRTLSKLTLHTDCCERLSKSPESFGTFLHLLGRHVKKEDIVVRLSFVLGNLTAKSEQARLALFHQKRSLDSLMTVFKAYIELDLRAGERDHSAGKTRESCTNKAPAKYEDVLVKIVRVIANLSISEEIGPVLASYPLYCQLLLHILERKNIDQSEELVLNTVATINNLSFYLCADEVVAEGLDLLHEIAEALRKFFLLDHMDGITEAARVFGNLSRHRPMRDYLVRHKVDRVLVTLLDSGSREVVYTACGVLINLMVDDDKRNVLKTEGGISKLIEVLRDFGRNDWQLATMVCQVLWNYSSRIKSANHMFGDTETQQLADLLVEYTDEELALNDSVLASMDEDTQDYVRDRWDTEFCPVATPLLARIDKYQSKFELLDPAS